VPKPRTGRWFLTRLLGKEVREMDGFGERFMWVVHPRDRPRWMPTQAGYMLMLVGVALMLVAYMSESNILFIAVSVLASTFLLSIILCFINLRRMRWRLHPEPHIRAGEPSDLVVEVQNGRRLVPAYAISFRLRTARTRQVVTLHQEQRVQPGGRGKVTWEYLPEARGRETFTMETVATQFPFGFLRKIVNGRTKQSVLIWPARCEYTFSAHAGQQSPSGGHETQRMGGGTEIANIRQYQRGDPQRRVHWKASAKQRKLMVQQMNDEDREGYVLYVETPEGVWQPGEQLERLCSVAASLAEDLFRLRQLRMVAVNSAHPIAVKRLVDLYAFFDQLADLEPQAHIVPRVPLSDPRTLTFEPGSLDSVSIKHHGQNVGTA